VTHRQLRLVALAVTLAPARATRLLERLEEEGAEEARRQAGLLATAPRRARLGALAAALVAAPLEPGAPSGPLPDHPLLRRLELERRERPAASRTMVRPASGPRDAAALYPDACRRHEA
jgi:hypothetical protein